MKFSVSREALLSAATLAAKATFPTPKPPDTTDAAARAKWAKNNQRAIQWALVKAEGDSLTLSGTDTEMWLSVRLAAKVPRAGVAVIDPEKLGKVLREYRDAEVSVQSAEEGTVRLTVGGAKYVFDTRDPNEFPDAPDRGPGPESSVPAGRLRDALRLAVAGAGENETESKQVFYTDAAQFAFGPEGLVVFGTDASRVHVTLLGGAAAEPASALLPLRATRALAAVLGPADAAEPVSVAAGKSVLCAAGANVSFTGRLLEGKGTPWKKAMPPDELPLKVGRAGLLSALRIALAARSIDAAVRLKFGAGGIVLSAKGKGGEAEYDVGTEGEFEGEAVVFGDHLAVFLAALSCEVVTLGIRSGRTLDVRGGDGQAGAFGLLADAKAAA